MTLKQQKMYFPLMTLSFPSNTSVGQRVQTKLSNNKGMNFVYILFLQVLRFLRRQLLYTDTVKL